jgi:hypothetical protein
MAELAEGAAGQVGGLISLLLDVDVVNGVLDGTIFADLPFLDEGFVGGVLALLGLEDFGQ